jgi:hypothetical protein
METNVLINVFLPNLGWGGNCRTYWTVLEQEKGKLTCMRLVRLADKPWLKVLFANLL